MSAKITKSNTEFIETPKGVFGSIQDAAEDQCKKQWYINEKLDTLIELQQKNLEVNERICELLLRKAEGAGKINHLKVKEMFDEDDDMTDEIPKAKGNTKEKKSKKEKKPKKAYVPPQDMGAPYNWNIEPFADKNGKTEDKDGNAFGLAVKYSFNKEFKAYIKDIGGTWQIRMKAWQFAEENAQEIVEKIQEKFPDWDFEDKRPVAIVDEDDDEDDEDDEDNDEDNEDNEDNDEDDDEDSD